jgi:hypothetical protein
MVGANQLLSKNASPEQISGWLKIRDPEDESMRVSHERSQRHIRHTLHSRVGGQSRGQIVDAISMRERSAEIEDGAIPGHWEGNLLGGTKNSHIAALVERHLRRAMLVNVPSKDTAAVVAALSRQVRRLPASLRRSLSSRAGGLLGSRGPSRKRRSDRSKRKPRRRVVRGGAQGGFLRTPGLPGLAVNVKRTGRRSASSVCSR